MTLFERKKHSVMRAAFAALVLVVPMVVPLAGPALAAEEEAAPQNEATEPLFAFLLSLVNGDSLGAWSGDDVAAYAAARGQVSKFPIEVVESIRRRRPQQDESARWPDTELRAMWEIRLVESLDRPMPYSILGYHPGSLRVSRELLLSELALGNKTFFVDGEGGPQGRRLGAVRALRLDRGSVILDADSLPDFVLGGNLDDAWTVGFAVAREGATQVGLAVSVKRDGGPIFGQFDFEQDRIMKSGSPLGSQLSAYCRGWFNRPGSAPPRTWAEAR